MAIADGHSTPVALYASAASPHESTLVEKTLRHTFLRQKPKRLIGDRAYDADPLDQRLAIRGIKLIAPHRRGRVKAKTQDGRELRRYCRRWKVERLFAWLQYFRHLTVRWDYHIHMFESFIMLGMIVILVRRLWN
jgi:transposase